MEDAAGRTAARTQATAADTDALDTLRWHWEDAYEIGHDPERGWWARRGDGLGGDVIASGPDELGAAIWENYTLKPVPRAPGGD